MSSLEDRVEYLNSILPYIKIEVNDYLVEIYSKSTKENLGVLKLCHNNKESNYYIKALTDGAELYKGEYLLEE